MTRAQFFAILPSKLSQLALERTIFNYIKKIIGKHPKHQQKKALSEATIIPRSEHCISKVDISRNALKVLNRLQSQGFDTYLVGGSVRDLLLHKAPKDFDVATEALPEEIRESFRNCRLIGRRFRLAHILFGRDIIEVATFRAAHDNKKHPDRHLREGMVIRDNVYGTLDQDVWRRDFTVNALYYNAANGSIVDFTNAMQDIKAKQLRLIGDPKTRYDEDPVRMLRAVRFATKLDFAIADETESLLPKMAHKLELIPAARLFEEILKLFQRGRALKNFTLLRKYNLFKQLFPMTDNLLQHPPADYPIEQLVEYTLRNTDQRIKDGKPVTPAFLLAAFLWYPLLQRTKIHEDNGIPPLPALEKAMNETVAEQCQTISIPRRFSKIMREMWFLQYSLPRRYGKRPFRVLEHPRFRAAYDFLLLRGEAGEISTELGEWWTEFQFAEEERRIEMLETKGPKRKRRRKPKAKSKSGSEHQSKPEPGPGAEPGPGPGPGPETKSE